jgi:rubrerythrin
VNLTAVVERYAGLEKRGMRFYRGLHERFHAHPAAARIWRELSNTEASHFALLELCQDWIALAGGGASAPPVTEESLRGVSALLTEIEADAARPECGLEEATLLTIRWEELELPRILELLPHLPGKARGQVMSGMVAEAEEHYRLLLELVNAAGAPAHGERVAALTERCRAALA